MKTDLPWTRRRTLAALLTGPIGLQAQSLHAASAGVLDWPTLVTIEGQTLAPERWRGRPAVVVFWATYCAFCKRHNAHIDKLFRAARDPDDLHGGGRRAGAAMHSRRNDGRRRARARAHRKNLSTPRHCHAGGAQRLRGIRRGRAGRQNGPNPGAKHRHSSGYGEHLQRRAAVFWRDERA